MGFVYVEIEVNYVTNDTWQAPTSSAKESSILVITLKAIGVLITFIVN